MSEAAENIALRLSASLSGSLPKERAWQKMSPPFRTKMGRISARKDARISAVLFLLFRRRGSFYLPFIRRAYNSGIHSGQMALPGGKKEKQDTDLVATALRETAEEIGVSADRSQVLGELSPLYIIPSNALVTPVVVWQDAPPTAYKAQAEEVDAVFEVRLDDLQSAKNRQEVEVSGLGMRFKTPAFVVNGLVIWGATAMMVSEFLMVWEKMPPK